MKMLLFSGKAESSDKAPVYCSERTDLSSKEIRFKTYPLSLLDIKIDNKGIWLDNERFDFENLPITIFRNGRHITKYREVIEEKITIKVEIIDIQTEAEI